MIHGSFKDKDGNLIELEIDGTNIEISDTIDDFQADEYESSAQTAVSVSKSEVNLRTFKYVNYIDSENYVNYSTCLLRTNWNIVIDGVASPLMVKLRTTEGALKFDYIIDSEMVGDKHILKGPLGDVITNDNAHNSSLVSWKFDIIKPDPFKEQNDEKHMIHDWNTMTAEEIAAKYYLWKDLTHTYLVTSIDGGEHQYYYDERRINPIFYYNGKEYNLKEVLFNLTGETGYFTDFKYHEISFTKINDVEEVIDEPLIYIDSITTYRLYKRDEFTKEFSYPCVVSYIKSSKPYIDDNIIIDGHFTTPKMYDSTVFANTGKLKEVGFLFDVTELNKETKQILPTFLTQAGKWEDYFGWVCNFTSIKYKVVEVAPSGLKAGALLLDSASWNSNSICWGADPITIEENIDDSFAPIITKTATIRLVTNRYVGELLKYSAPSVEIRKNGTIIFGGYVEPYTFSQPFANYIEEIELNCIDLLGIKQYRKFYEHIYNPVEIKDWSVMNWYEHMKKYGTQINFGEWLVDMLKHDYELSEPIDIWYDCSKQIDSKSLPEQFFNQLEMAPSVLYGDDYDDCLTQQDVLANLLTYCNLHIKQEGSRFYIFDWDSIRGTQIVWASLITGTKYNHRLPRNQISISKSAGNDTNITTVPPYSQILITCDLEDEDTSITSPLDEDNITSVWPNKQFYCREYMLEHKNDKSAFTTLVRNQAVDNRNYNITDYYIQVLHSKEWTFGTHDGNYIDLFKYDDYGNYINATDVLRYAKSHYFTPVLLNVTKVTNPTKREDNGAEYEAERSTQLYITVNGNDYINAEIKGDKLPSDNELQSYNCPIATYRKTTSGSFTPADASTTNYLVFKGKIKLIPNQQYNIFDDWFNHLDEEGIRIGMAYNNTWPKNLSFRGNCLYGRRFFDLRTPQDKPNFNAVIAEPNLLLKDMHLSATDKDYKGEFYKYNWTAASDRGTDKIKKIPLICCYLRIGDKCLVESKIDENGNSTFTWQSGVAYDSFSRYKDTTYSNGEDWISTHCFSLGINPKLGDFIVGTDFDIQNTITFDMNLGDEKGTAIPIKYSDELSGDIEFHIVGLYNITWNDVIYRHGTWFRKKKWTDNYKELLPKLRSICLTDFECKIVSDNAQLEPLEDDNDLVYASDESLRYLNFKERKDDITFEFVTQPTSAECMEKGLKNGIFKNIVLAKVNGKTKPLATIFNCITHETAKPEEHYIDQYWREFKETKLTMSSTVHNTGAIDFSHYYSKLLDKNFYIFNKTYNVVDNTFLVNLKEI